MLDLNAMMVNNFEDVDFKKLIKMVYDAKEIGVDLCLAVDKYDVENNYLINRIRVIDCNTIDIYNCELNFKWWVIFRPYTTLDDTVEYIQRKFCKCDVDTLLFDNCKCNIPARDEILNIIYDDAVNHINTRLEICKKDI